MPIYEYRGESCGHTLDALQKLSDARLTDCPECAQSALKRLISAPSFRLKGSGWYETDFKTDKESRRNLAEGAGEPKDSESASKKSKDSESSGKEKSPDATTAKPGKDKTSSKTKPDAKSSRNGKSTGSEAA